MDAVDAEEIWRAPERYLFIGPTGVGKSLILNMCYNEDYNKDALLKPAKTGGSTQGQTANFPSYFQVPMKPGPDSQAQHNARTPHTQTRTTTTFQGHRTTQLRSSSSHPRLRTSRSSASCCASAN